MADPSASRGMSEEPAVIIVSGCHLTKNETTGVLSRWSLLGIRVYLLCSHRVKTNRNLLQSPRTIPHFSPLPVDIFSSSQKRSSWKHPTLNASYGRLKAFTGNLLQCSGGQLSMLFGFLLLMTSQKRPWRLCFLKRSMLSASVCWNYSSHTRPVQRSWQ